MVTDGSLDQSDLRGINALKSREPGYSVALQCLSVQSAREAEDPSLRTSRGVILHPDAWSWYQGALGEMEVGRLLRALGSRWFVRHSVPIGAGTTDVDHLLIGPAGVFALNTKHHRGAAVWVGEFKLTVNRGDTEHLRVAKGEAVNVSRRLSAKVDFAVVARPVLVIVGERALTANRRSDNPLVVVVSSSNLLTWLSEQPRTLTDTQLALLRLVAEEPATWHIDPLRADTFRVMQRFDRLRESVGDYPVRWSTPAVVSTTAGIDTPSQWPRTVQPAMSGAGLHDLLIPLAVSALLVAGAGVLQLIH